MPKRFVFTGKDKLVGQVNYELSPPPHNPVNAVARLESGQRTKGVRRSAA